MSQNSRLIGLAPLSVLGTEPVDLIRAAAKTGYDFVGLRVQPVTAAEPDLNMLHGNRRQKEALAALKDTGIKVVDIEFLLLDGQVGREVWLPMMEAGAALGARSLTLAVADTDVARVTDTLAQMVADGKPLGIAPTVEPISYQAVKQLADGVPYAEAAGARLLLDTLHFARAFSTLEQIPAAVPYIDMIQLCDGFLNRRADHRDGLIHESRAHREVPGEGDFPLAECVAALPESTLISMETPNPKFAEMGLEAYAAHLLAAARRMIVAAQG